MEKQEKSWTKRNSLDDFSLVELVLGLEGMIIIMIGWVNHHVTWRWLVDNLDTIWGEKDGQRLFNLLHKSSKHCAVIKPILPLYNSNSICAAFIKPTYLQYLGNKSHKYNDGIQAEFHHLKRWFHTNAGKADRLVTRLLSDAWDWDLVDVFLVAQFWWNWSLQIRCQTAEVNWD